MTTGVIALAVPLSTAFAGEFLILAGVFPQGWGWAVIGAVSIVLAAMYVLRLISAVLHEKVGAAVSDAALDLRPGELAIVVPLVAHPARALGLADRDHRPRVRGGREAPVARERARRARPAATNELARRGADQLARAASRPAATTAAYNYELLHASEPTGRSSCPAATASASGSQYHPNQRGRHRASSTAGASRDPQAARRLVRALAVAGAARARPGCCC